MLHLKKNINQTHQKQEQNDIFVKLKKKKFKNTCINLLKKKKKDNT